MYFLCVYLDKWSGETNKKNTTEVPTFPRFILNLKKMDGCSTEVLFYLKIEK